VTTTRALVLGGGGVGGIAWLLGIVTSLREAGVDLDTADVLVGTSAGAAVAAQLATGQLEAAAAMQQQEETTEIAATFDIEKFQTMMFEAAMAGSDRQDTTRRMANIPDQGPGVSVERRREVIAARLPLQEWPDRDLRITVVRKASGERLVLDRHGPSGLVDAVAASCAVPGIWPAVTIDGEVYVDGGVHSTTNADLAAGADLVLVLVPVMLDEVWLGPMLSQEQQTLLPGRSKVVAVDEASLAAIGPNPLDPTRRAAAFAAGRAQGAAAANEVAAFWES
jgi:NTE family protein